MTVCLRPYAPLFLLLFASFHPCFLTAFWIGKGSLSGHGWPTQKKLILCSLNRWKCDWNCTYKYSNTNVRLLRGSKGLIKKIKIKQENQLLNVHKKHYLKNSTHPLKTVFLCGIWPLLSNNNYPFIMQHTHWKHCYSIEEKERIFSVMTGENTILSSKLTVCNHDFAIHYFHAAFWKHFGSLIPGMSKIRIST